MTAIGSCNNVTINKMTSRAQPYYKLQLVTVDYDHMIATPHLG